MIKINNYSYPTSLYCISLSITASMAKNKQSADSKQTADLLKSHKFLSMTSITYIPILLWPLNGCILQIFRKKKKKERPNIIHWPARFAAGKNMHHNQTSRCARTQESQGMILYSSVWCQPNQIGFRITRITLQCNRPHNPRPCLKLYISTFLFK